VYRRAMGLIRSASLVVAIGYRFASCDYVSFRPLLATTTAKARVLVVGPESEETVTRLVSSPEHVRAEPMPMTFERWVAHGFPGLSHA
jgi:hypothetical protein